MGITEARTRGASVTEAQREAVIAGAVAAASQARNVTAYQVQMTAKRAALGALSRSESASALRIRLAVEGAVAGALDRSESASLSQMKSAAQDAATSALGQSGSGSGSAVQVQSSAQQAARIEATDGDVRE